MASPDPVQLLATILFMFAIVHTFLVKRFERLAMAFPTGSVLENLFHVLGEVEVVFGIWASIFLIAMGWIRGPDSSISYLEGLNFTEPAFVFVIMAVCASRPVIHAANLLLSSVGAGISWLTRAPVNPAFYFTALCLGPLLGSFITEPAAMTAIALILKRRFFDRSVSNRFKYVTLGTLFVNVSIGGVLTPYAAPPVLMVAGRWGWGLSHMAAHFGWKAAIACAVNALVAAVLFAREIKDLGHHHATTQMAGEPAQIRRVPWWLMVTHLGFLAAIVVGAHHIPVFVGFFLFFLGMVRVTREYQEPLRLQEGLLVGFFLGGLVVMGGMQRWWLEPLIQSLGELPLFLGATALTAVTDNAALTYLGAQVPGISEGLKYALVSGAVAGGGLTVIANAPNPAGYGILKSSFGEGGISPGGLFVSALFPTLVAMGCLWLL